MSPHCWRQTGIDLGARALKLSDGMHQSSSSSSRRRAVRPRFPLCVTTAGVDLVRGTATGTGAGASTVRTLGAGTGWSAAVQAGDGASSVREGPAGCQRGETTTDAVAEDAAFDVAVMNIRPPAIPRAIAATQPITMRNKVHLPKNLPPTSRSYVWSGGRLFRREHQAPRASAGAASPSISATAAWH